MFNSIAKRIETRPNPIHIETVESETGANIAKCWTCGSCDFECPVNIATNLLRPQVLVRLAAFGFLDELANRREIWYCLDCRRCIQICPNCVKPASVVAFAREEGIRKGNFDKEAVRRYRIFFYRFQRVRWRTMDMCLKGGFDGISEDIWDEWLNTPVPELDYSIHFPKSYKFSCVGAPTNISSCFACGECSSTCPISCERAVFDARSLVRMAAFGMTGVLLESPFIWLCLSCGRCSEACSQLVDICGMIRELREKAFLDQILDSRFEVRMERANRLILGRFIKEIDRIFGF